MFLVGDTGAGSPDVVHNIFNPFFTTKAKGRASGFNRPHHRGEARRLDPAGQQGKGKGNLLDLLPLVPREPGAEERILEQMSKGGGDGSGAKNNQG